MIKIIVLLAVILIVKALNLSPSSHLSSQQDKNSKSQEKRQLRKIKRRVHYKRSLQFGYTPKVDPQSYRNDEIPSPRIMKYLPLTQRDIKIAPLITDIKAVKKYYLNEVNYQKTVDMKKAKHLARLLGSQQGQKILTYFQGLAEHSLNYYNLSQRNYYLWLAIKILARDNIQRYARTVAQDQQLFKEFYEKAREKKIRQIIGISSPSVQLLKQLSKPLKNMPNVSSQYGSTKPQKKHSPQKAVKDHSPSSLKHKDSSSTDFFPQVQLNPDLISRKRS